MAAKRRKKAAKKKAIDSYDHKDKKRPNNPPVGLVTPDTDPDQGKKTYAYDPHLDPQLVWAGKAEHTSFEVPTVSLHVHERIDPKTIIEAVRKRNGDPKGQQLSLFEAPEENLPLREAIEFYKHAHGWTNRLIAGDSLFVMNSLLEKEGMAGKVQMVYIDPPYGIRYGSNFQPFVNQRSVSEAEKDHDLSSEPETIRAFRDTWELGVHSYLTYLRDRLLLARELLCDGGSCFLQIGEENVHLVRCLGDEVFGHSNLHAQINFKSKSALGQKGLARTYDYILWYAKDSSRMKFQPIFKGREIKDDREWRFIDDPDTEMGYRRISEQEFAALNHYSGVFRRSKLTSSGFTQSCTYSFVFQGVECRPFGGKSWVTTPEGMQRLIERRRIFLLGRSPYFKQYYEDFPVVKHENSWSDQPPPAPRRYVVETAPKFIRRCMLMVTDPGDLVLDPTCGSGTTAYVAEKWGRRWITCDTSRISVALARQRLMGAVFDYYTLAHPEEGVASGFKYRTVAHITPRTLANDEPAPAETLYDDPHIDASKGRVAGPFTVEAVPSPTVRPVGDVSPDAVMDRSPEVSVARVGPTIRQSEWTGELLKCGIRAKGGQHIHFSRVEPLPGARWLHADAETKDDQSKRVVVSFGPEHAPLEQRQVALAIEEAQSLAPRPAIVAFASFHFDPEAAKDIDETKWPGVTLLKVQMNTDLLTEDLKKKRASNESFWMIGQPDIQVRKLGEGEHKGNWQVEVQGFDYYDPRTGSVVSGDTSKIAMWMLDQDYDGRSLYPRQVFFPMAGEKDGWARLAKNLKAEIDEERIEAYRGSVSLPFEAGEYGRVAVKIVDDRGIESLRIVDLK